MNHIPSTNANVRRRRGGRALASLLCGAVLAMSGAGSLAATYKFTDLGTLGRDRGEGWAISADGQIVGISESTDWQVHATLWKGKRAIDLGPPDSYSYPRAINNHGVIVGDSTPAGSTITRATRWHRGEITDLGTFGGSKSFARGVDRCGRIVGTAQLAGDVASHAFLWSDGMMVDLGTLGGTGSTGEAINSLGQIAGSSRIVGDAVTHAALWSDGTLTDLGTLGQHQRRFSAAVALNDTGSVVGLSQATPGGAIHATLWQGGAAVDLGTLGGRNSGAHSINNAGQIVGYSDGPKGKPGRHRRAVLWQDGQMIDLTPLLDRDARKSGWVLTSARAINDAGVITGIADNKLRPGVWHAFRLTPRVPAVRASSPATAATGCNVQP